MAIIGLEGMYFRAGHGFYEEEHLLGNDFEVDVFLDVDVDMAAHADDLFETVNYELVHHICFAVMKEPVQLIETIAMQIAERLQSQFAQVHGVRVKVSKLNPPLGHKVARASIELSTGSLEA
jgi:dihydroneopterin aldolase